MVARVSAILMIISLVWLTVSLPFVFQAMNAHHPEHSACTDCPLPSDDEELPVNASEEKSPVNNGAQEEYLHYQNEGLILASQFLTHSAGHHASVYIAYHGELLSPPPEVIS
jgi:hypothetical protein